MKIQRDKLRQYQKKIQTVLDREHQIAKEMVKKGDNARALLALRKRKYQEQLLVKTDGQLQALEELVCVPPFSLRPRPWSPAPPVLHTPPRRRARLTVGDRQTSTIEFSLVQRDVLYGLRQGNQVLKEIHREMSLESVEKLMEETADGIAYQREISNMLAGRMSNEEEDEAEDELAQMEREERIKTMQAQMPGAPVAVPATKEHVLGAEHVQEDEEGTEAERKARRAKERAKARRQELARAKQEPMLA